MTPIDVAAENGIEVSHSPAAFGAALAEHEAASRWVSRAILAEQETRAELAEFRRMVEQIEAEWVRDGLLLGDRAPKNEGERDAARTLARQTVPEYRRRADLVRRGEQLVAHAAADLEAAREARSAARRRMDYAIALTTLLAGGE